MYHGMCSERKIPFKMALLELATKLFCFCSIIANVALAKSSLQYNPYQYDKTVPQFAPDGRLAQLEYAKLASEHSHPVVVVAIKNNMMLFCTLRAQQQNNMKHFIAQDRLIVIQDSESDLTTGVVVVLSGVLADSLLLLRYVEEEALWTARNYGMDRLSALEIASVVTLKCQQNAFGGGIRPYGASLLVAGVQSKIGSSSSFVLYLTDPSGALHHIEPFRHEAFLVTGEGEASNLLRNRIRSEWQALTGDNEKPEHDEGTPDIMQPHQNSAYPSNPLSVNQIPNFIDFIANEQKKFYSTREQQDETLYSLEVVLFSMADGIVKLDHMHLEAIRARQTMSK